MEVDSHMSDTDTASIAHETSAETDDDPDAVTESFIYQLRDCIDTENKKATFACGGTIPILRATKPTDTSHPVASAAVALRWDSPREKTRASETKLVFPLEVDTDANLASLVRDTAPASFGRGTQAIYDEDYRKATKMEPTEFSTTFNPYELGIIDTIAQMLLPSTLDSDRYRAVRAELYKLNIYSAPSGRFKPHVDTPRSVDQFGSLVVCLPVEHEGGHLQVRHRGKEMTFDWGTSRTDPDHASIRWAAFYSDCEHEVLDVLSGHRVTLTYNLYAVRGNGLMTGYCPSLDPTHLPLYQYVDSMLGEEEFMAEGGYLGFFCTHAYPHNAPAHSPFPDVLKGLDMVIWQTFTALGLRTRMCPVAVLPGRDEKGKETKEKDDGSDDGERDVGRGYVGRDFGVQLWPGWGDAVSERPAAETWARGAGQTFRFEDVAWLTEPLPESELQIVYGAYGNNPGLFETVYSRCAVVVRVPPHVDRVAGITADDSDDDDENEDHDKAEDEAESIASSSDTGGDTTARSSSI